MDYEEKIGGHEKLRIYPQVIQLVEWICTDISGKSARDPKLLDQLSRASSSIPLNIAEGSGKTTERDKKRFYAIARGSAMECSAIFDVLHARKLIDSKDRNDARDKLRPIIGVLTTLSR